jgi:hypothetical protein
MSAVLTDQFHLSLDLSPLAKNNAELAVLAMYNGSWRIYHLNVTGTVDFTGPQCDHLLESLNQHRPDTPEHTWFYYIGQIFPVAHGPTAGLRFFPLNDIETFDMFRVFTYCCPDCIALEAHHGTERWCDPGHLAELHTPKNPERCYSRYISQCLDVLSMSEQLLDESDLINTLAEHYQEPAQPEPQYNTQAF